MCTIATPFELYKYTRLAVEFKCSSDFAQATIEKVLCGIEDADVYIDNIGVFPNNWDSHMKSLDKILCRLRNNRFTINPLKCKWAIQETDWLG